MNQRLLLIEDTATLQMIYCANLTDAGYDVDVASSGIEGLEIFSAQSNPVVIMDLFLPDIDGVEVIRKLIQGDPQTKIIVITSNGSVNRAVGAMRAGAFDFLLKPFSDERLLATVSSALASFGGRSEINLESESFYGFAGRGRIMKEMHRNIKRIAKSTAPVFMVGERGVGKLVCANAIHEHSELKSGPFVTFNCGDLTTVEQEIALFGAMSDTEIEPPSNEISALQKAYGGTLYIDDISELSPVAQTRLAVLLQTANQSAAAKESPSFLMPRIICSTRIDPYFLLETEKIKEDLFYQLHILTINIPPLRELGSDIVYVAETYLERHSRSENKSFSGFSNEVSEAFISHDWPGNINQLGNLLYKIVANHDANLVSMDMLPVSFLAANRKNATNSGGAKKDQFLIERSSNAIHQLVGLPLDELEREFIDATILSQGGSIPKAAEVLGLAPSTIYRKRSKH